MGSAAFALIGFPVFSEASGVLGLQLYRGNFHVEAISSPYVLIE